MISSRSRLHDTAAPELAQRLPMTGALQATHALPGRPSIRVRVHRRRPGSTALRRGEPQVVRVLEWRDGRIEPIQELDLGTGVIRMERSGSWFAIHDMQVPEGGYQSYGLRFLDLGASTLTVSKRHPATSMLRGFAAHGSALHVVYSERRVLEPPNSATMREQFSIEELRVTPALDVQQVKLCSLETPRSAAGCVVSRARAATSHRGDRAAGDRTLITFVAPNVAQSIDHRTCAIAPLELAGDHFMVTPDGERLIGLGPADSASLDVSMYDVKQLGAPAVRAHVELAKPKLRDDSIASD